MDLGQEVGHTGLRVSRGSVQEEFLFDLKGDRGAKRYREMADNDAAIGAVLMLLEMWMRQAEWRTVPYSDEPDDVERADFADSLRHDMSMTWEDVISEILTMVPYGWSLLEIVYKTRQGPDGQHTSQHDDGKIGWRKLPSRSQDTLDHWQFDEEGGVEGMWQKQPEGSRGKPVFIPIEKALLFRTTIRKNNPEGRSALRSAYRAWYYKTHMEEIEAIGVERDISGIPTFGLPAECLAPDAPSDKAAVANAFRQMGENIRNDEQAYIMYPLEYDENGNPLYSVSLLGSAGEKMFDTSAIITRWTQHMVMSVLADVMLMGHEKVGTESLANTKARMLQTALQTWLNMIADVFNRHALPRIFRLNNMSTINMPRYEPGRVEQPDMREVAEVLNTVAQAGYPLFPDDELEEWVATKVGMPRTPQDQRDLEPLDDVPLMPVTDGEPGNEEDIFTSDDQV